MTYEYKLLKADILELAEMAEYDDISLSLKKFEESKDNKLLVVEYLIYNLDKHTVEKESEEILNKVLSILKGNEKIKLEIISHTDS
jgi:outer membrane protein OmpA-like peptidoglycan-associated protein